MGFRQSLLYASGRIEVGRGVDNLGLLGMLAPL